jgi:hypothetical protein
MFGATRVRNTLHPMLYKDDIDLSLKLQGRVVYQTTGIPILPYIDDEIRFYMLTFIPTYKKVCSGDDVACIEILF